MNQALSQYYIFYVAARCGNISRASRELFISQPAVSKSIRKLEQSLHTVPVPPGAPGRTPDRRRRAAVPPCLRGFCLSGNGGAVSGAEARPGDLSPAHRRQHNPVQIRASSVSAAVHPASSPCKNHHYLPVHLPYPGPAAGGKIDVGLVGRPASLKGCEFRPLQSIQDTFVATAAYLSTSPSGKRAVLSSTQPPL